MRIVDFEGFASEFAHVDYLSCLFSLRVSSETLMLRRDFPVDPIADHAHQPDKALIKLATMDGHPYLVMKFSIRKNLVYGCIIRRPCFSVWTKQSLALCPAYTFWPLIKARVQSGHLLFPTITRRNLNRIIKAAHEKLADPHSERYSSHAFRRGSAQELQETGSPWAVVDSAGAPLAYSATRANPRT